MFFGFEPIRLELWRSWGLRRLQTVVQLSDNGFQILEGLGQVLPRLRCMYTLV